MKSRFKINGCRIRPCWALALALALPVTVSGQDAPATQPGSDTGVDINKLFPAHSLNAGQEDARRKLEDALDAARDPLDRVLSHVALANWLLAVPTARPATKWVLGVENANDRHMLAEYAATASEQLAEARNLLKAGSGATAENTKNRRRRLAAEIENLEAFANVFAAVREIGDEAALKERWPSAAIGLAGARESDNNALAASATLWQAMAWEKAGRRERALMTLPEALAKPDYAHAFMARILRCRILSDGGQHAAAIALAIQIRARVEDWFPRERPNGRLARERLAGLMQLQIGQAWLEQFQPATPSLEEGLKEIQRDVMSLFSPGEEALEIYVLAEAIPTIVEPPSIRMPLPQPEDESATRPDESATRPEKEESATRPEE